MVEQSEPLVFRPYVGTRLLPVLTPTYQLALLLIVLQISDAYLTAIGVSRFGFEAEGNPFLRPLMENFGHVPVLITVKTLAIACIVMLAEFATQVRWIPKALWAMSCFYFFVAIVPWTYFLVFAPVTSY